MNNIDDIEQQEELHTQLRALSCAFSYSTENGKNILTVEYSNTKKSQSDNKISDALYDKIVRTVKSYYDGAKVITSSDYNTKFLIS